MENTLWKKVTSLIAIVSFVILSFGQAFANGRHEHQQRYYNTPPQRYYGPQRHYNQSRHYAPQRYTHHNRHRNHGGDAALAVLGGIIAIATLGAIMAPPRKNAYDREMQYRQYENCVQQGGHDCRNLLPQR